MAVPNASPFPTPEAGRLSLWLIAIAVFVALLYFGRIFFVTVTIALIISFILEPFVTLVMRFRLPRGVASFLVCSIALFLLYLAGLGLYTQVGILVEDLPNYSQRINDLVDRVTLEIEKMENTAYQLLVPKRLRETQQVQAQPPAQPPGSARRRRAPEPALPPPVQEVRIHQDRPPLFNYLYNYISGFYQALLMASFVPFLVYFMLSWRDHVRRSFLQLFHGTARGVAGKSWEGIGNMARAYVVGNFVLGIALSLVSMIFFFIVRLPYPFLIGPVSGFLSLVPYVGLPLALVPPIAAALVVNNNLSLYFAIGVTISFLHLIALNLLYPKMVGSRVHLNPLAVTVALMFWGTLWGAIGLVLAIPITAGIKAVCDNVDSLQAYGRLLGD